MWTFQIDFISMDIHPLANSWGGEHLASSTTKTD